MTAVAEPESGPVILSGETLSPRIPLSKLRYLCQAKW